MRSPIVFTITLSRFHVCLSKWRRQSLRIHCIQHPLPSVRFLRYTLSSAEAVLLAMQSVRLAAEVGLWRLNDKEGWEGGPAPMIINSLMKIISKRICSYSPAFLCLKVFSSNFH